MKNKFLKKIIADIPILNLEVLFYLNRKQQGQLQVEAM